MHPHMRVVETEIAHEKVSQISLERREEREEREKGRPGEFEFDRCDNLLSPVNSRSQQSLSPLQKAHRAIAWTRVVIAGEKIRKKCLLDPARQPQEERKKIELKKAQLGAAPRGRCALERCLFSSFLFSLPHARVSATSLVFPLVSSLAS